MHISVCGISRDYFYKTTVIISYLMKIIIDLNPCITVEGKKARRMVCSAVKKLKKADKVLHYRHISSVFLLLFRFCSSGANIPNTRNYKYYYNITP